MHKKTFEIFRTDLLRKNRELIIRILFGRIEYFGRSFWRKLSRSFDSKQLRSFWQLKFAKKLGLISVVPSDHSVRVSKIPASADAMNPMTTMIAHIDESCKLIKHSNCSRTLSSSSGIQKTFTTFETQITSDQEIASQIDGGKCFFPVQQANKSPKKTSENKEVSVENKLKKIFPLMMFSNEPLPTASQRNQQDQFLAFSPSHTSSPSSPVGTTIAADFPKQQAPNQERTISSASSTSSAQKSVISFESLPANLELIKTVSV